MEQGNPPQSHPVWINLGLQVQNNWEPSRSQLAAVVNATSALVKLNVCMASSAQPAVFRTTLKFVSAGIKHANVWKGNDM